MQECLPLQREMGRSKLDLVIVMGAGSSNEEAGMSKSNSGTVMAGASSDEEGIGR